MILAMMVLEAEMEVMAATVTELGLPKILCRH